MATKKWLRSDAPFNPLSNLGKTFLAEDMSLICYVFVCFWFVLYFYLTIILILGVELLHIRSASNSLWKTCHFNRSPFTHASPTVFDRFNAAGPCDTWRSTLLWKLWIWGIRSWQIQQKALPKREAAKSISKAMQICLEVSIRTLRSDWSF